MKAYEVDLSLYALPLSQFSEHNRATELSAEVSCLEGFQIRQLYTDACDVGIAIRSHHTGKVERFVLSKEDMNADYEIMGWHFVPVNPNCRVKKVLVIND